MIGGVVAARPASGAHCLTIVRFLFGEPSEDMTKKKPRFSVSLNGEEKLQVQKVSCTRGSLRIKEIPLPILESRAWTQKILDDVPRQLDEFDRAAIETGSVPRYFLPLYLLTPLPLFENRKNTTEKRPTEASSRNLNAIATAIATAIALSIAIACCP